MKKSLPIFLFAFFFCWQMNLSAQTQNSEPFTKVGEVQASTLNFLGKTEPLRDLIEMSGLSLEKRKKIKKNKKPIEVPNFMGRIPVENNNPNAYPKGPDPLWQKNQTKNTGIVVEPLIVIEGMSSNNFGGTPPDPAGDIGTDYFVQMINGTFFRIFDKEGNAVTDATNTNTLWSPLGFTGLGDPIILYDQGAGRWFVTEFAQQGNNLLVAVSESGDPQGSYFVYNFTTPSFPDYPKYGVWNNAYVITTNEGVGSFYVMEREKMLVGEPNPGLQRFTNGNISGIGFQVSTPVGWDGMLEPPIGADPMIIRINDDAWNNINQDRLQVYSINIDWETPANSSVTLQNLPTAPFDSQGCAQLGAGFDCIPQPSGNAIDGIPRVIMNRVQYRNFEDYEAMVLNFMVDVSGTNNEISGIRWMELRRTSGEPWFIYQEGTYAPEGTIDEHRFMGGIAMDGAGNIGLAYSVSGPETSPALRFTGRRNGDPLGEMTVDEYEFATGEGSIGGVRFGDYAAIGVDPADERTFWFTGEYKRPNFAWGTKIVAFQISRDTNDIGPFTMFSPESADDLTEAEIVEADFRNFGVDTQTVFTVGYIINDGPAFFEEIDTILPQDSVYHHVFSQTADLSEIGDYNFKIFTDLAEDTNPANDTLRMFVRKLPRFDAGVTGINLEADNLCGMNTPVEFELTNFGTQMLTSVNITYILNGAATTTIPWSGGLTMNETEIISINLMDLQDGVNSLTVFSSEPNGEADEIPANDNFVRNFETMAEGIPVDFWLKFDFNPDETFWRLTNSQNQILYTGGTYPDANPLTTVNEEFCLHPDECYTFTILDIAMDGISMLDGDYTLTHPDGTVLASLLNPDFGFSESNYFCASGSCLLEANIDANINPDTGNGTIIINAANGSGDLEYSIDGGNSWQSSNVFQNLNQGEYIIVVMDGNGCDYIQEFDLNPNTNTFNEELGYNIKVFPNPTEGVFRINIEGLQVINYLDLQILDASGKIVQHAAMSKYNGILTGVFSLDNFADGVYFVRFENDKIKNLVRVVKQ